MTPVVWKVYVDTQEPIQQRDANQRNADAWAAGMYVLEAIGAAFGKNHIYPKEPYREKTAEEQKEQLIATLEGLRQGWKEKHAGIAE